MYVFWLHQPTRVSWNRHIQNISTFSEKPDHCYHRRRIRRRRHRHRRRRHLHVHRQHIARTIVVFGNMANGVKKLFEETVARQGDGGDMQR